VEVTDQAEAEDRRHASQRVADILEAKIAAGDYPPNTQLPSYRQLAAENGIALNTAQAAVKILHTRGKVTIRPSSGAYVRDQAAGDATDVHQVRADLEAIREQLRQQAKDLAATEQAVSAVLDRLPVGAEL
jgi:DNA-binding transcriptional regulator YhcF (GntR family)